MRHGIYATAAAIALAGSFLVGCSQDRPRLSDVAAPSGKGADMATNQSAFADTPVSAASTQTAVVTRVAVGALPEAGFDRLVLRLRDTDTAAVGFAITYSDEHPNVLVVRVSGRLAPNAIDRQTGKAIQGISIQSAERFETQLNVSLDKRRLFRGFTEQKPPRLIVDVKSN